MYNEKRIQDHIGIVHHQATNFSYGSTVVLDELFSQGLEVLMECDLKYDDSKGIPFNSYLTKMLRFKYMNHLNSKKHRNTQTTSLDTLVFDDNDSISLLDTVGVEDTYQVEQDYNEIVKVLKSSIDKLQPKPKRIILRVLDMFQNNIGRKNSKYNLLELSKEFDCSMVTVRHHIISGMEDLRYFMSLEGITVDTFKDILKRL